MKNKTHIIVVGRRPTNTLCGRICDDGDAMILGRLENRTCKSCKKIYKTNLIMAKKKKKSNNKGGWLGYSDDGPIRFATTMHASDVAGTLRTDSDAVFIAPSNTYSVSTILYNTVNPNYVGIGTMHPKYKLEVALSTMPNTTTKNGDIALSGVGSAIRYHQGSANDMAGTIALSSGTATVSISGLATTDIAIGTITSGSGTLGTLQYKCTAGVLTITSLTTANTTQTLDNSTVSYFIVRKY